MPSISERFKILQMKNKFTKGTRNIILKEKDKYYKGKLIMFVKKKALVEFQKNRETVFYKNISEDDKNIVVCNKNETNFIIEIFGSVSEEDNNLLFDRHAGKCELYCVDEYHCIYFIILFIVFSKRCERKQRDSNFNEIYPKKGQVLSITHVPKIQESFYYF